MKRVALLILLFGLLPLPLCAQQIGASITGHIVDPSGAAVVGANIKLTSMTTGSVYTAGSDTAGIYQIPFASIGAYSLTVEKEGFKKCIQDGIGLVAGQKAVIDIRLQLGTLTQMVTVVANAPLLQSESGDRGWTISNTRLDPEVFRGQNTIESTWFAPGVTVASAEQKIRPFDTSGTQDEEINGGQDGDPGNLETAQGSGNQVMVDGISSNIEGNGIAFNPIAATVEQVTVQGTMFDAQYGWSTGGHIDTLTKGGTNTWHGHAYDYVQNTLFNAEDWSSIQHGTGRLPWHINMFGGEIGGRLRKDKIFVYYAFQQIWQVQRDPFTAAVPTAAERQGNFNGVLNGGAQIQLYDPSTTATTSSNADPTSCYYNQNGVSTGQTPCRSQNGPMVSNNVILNVNPIAAKVMSIIPLPNAPGVTSPCPAGVTAAVCGTFQGNILTGPTSRKFADFFPQHSGRIDWNFSDKTRAFFRFSKNDLAESRGFIYSTASAINPADTSGSNPFFRTNQTYALQVTHTFNPTTVLEFRTGMDRFPYGSGAGPAADYDPTALGFSSTFASEAFHHFPMLSISSMNGTGNFPSSYTDSENWNHEVVLSHTRGQHNIRFGYQRFDLADYVENPLNNNGLFSFSGYFTQANPLGTTGPTGYGLADFELGYPISGSIAINAWPEYWMHEHSFFVQDDYHLSRKLTLNMGLRWDYAGPVHDKRNRLLNGFCTTCLSPLNSPGLTVVGGPTFAGVAGASSSITNRKYDNFGPRFAFAYDMGHDTVVRGGWGIIYGQQMLEPGGAPGFSQNTNLNAVPGAAGIFNPNISLANPFPNGLIPVVGSADGLASGIGNAISFPDPNMDIPRTQQYSLEFQHSLGHNWLVTLGYVGSRATRLNVNQVINYPPLADLPWTPSFQPNPTGYTASQLSSQVTNPFYGKLPTAYAPLATGTYLANPTISLAQAVQPYPQFSAGGITELWVPIGRSHYNSMQFEVNKRLSMGLEFTANFTWSKTLQALGFLNAQDPAPSQTIARYDMPRQVKVNVAYYAPFGPGKRFLSQTNPFVSRLVSGWSLSAVSRINDGFPATTPYGMMPIKGAIETTPHPTLSHWFNTCYLDLGGGKHDCSIDSTPAWQLEQSRQLYEWSPYLTSIRYVGTHRVDAGIKKETTIKERFQLTYRADFVNAFNSAEWVGDLDTYYFLNFGVVGYPDNTPSDDPRVIMMSLQLKF